MRENGQTAESKSRKLSPVTKTGDDGYLISDHSHRKDLASIFN